MKERSRVRQRLAVGSWKRLAVGARRSRAKNESQCYVPAGNKVAGKKQLLVSSHQATRELPERVYSPPAAKTPL